MPFSYRLVQLKTFFLLHLDVHSVADVRPAFSLCAHELQNVPGEAPYHSLISSL
jgi:hypothetical protein